MSDVTRLVARSHPEPPPPGVDGDCLIWHGARNNNGYGYIADPDHPGRVVGVHRLSWTTQIGPVSPGLHVLHRCDRRACWTVGHLFLGTHADNMADMVSKGRTANGGTSQTHCKRGHPLAYLRSNGQRTCRFGSDCGRVERILTTTAPVTAAIREFLLTELAAGRNPCREDLQARFGASASYARRLLVVIRRYHAERARVVPSPHPTFREPLNDERPEPDGTERVGENGRTGTDGVGNREPVELGAGA